MVQVNRVDDSPAQEQGPDAVDDVAGKGGHVAGRDTGGQPVAAAGNRHGPNLAVLVGRDQVLLSGRDFRFWKRRAIQHAGTSPADHFLLENRRELNVALGFFAEHGAPGRRLRDQDRPIEKGEKTVIVRLFIAVNQGMIVTLAAGQVDTQE